MSPFTTAGTAFDAVPALAPDRAHPYWTFERVAQAIGTGPAMPNALAGISTDTRQIARGDLFVALRGDRFDAHDFLAAAKAAGAAAFVVSDASRAVGLGVPTYVVPDTLVALGQLATAWRKAWGRTVIAVAGSNGKTSTKELLKAALGRTLHVYATPGNLNNAVGVPLTLLGIPSEADVAVVEVGTSAPGEVTALRAIAGPDVAVLTSIGEEHLGTLDRARTGEIGITVDEQHVMAVGDELAGDGSADLPGPGDGDTHQVSLGPDSKTPSTRVRSATA